ncbi:serine/threonine-protein kinase [Vulcanisaeta thermophila]|uniref:serine/threonine-protein kinase n=1 Tax=Vulcanisaeta thermophila TaxID=867917 RepID=UPI000852EAAD|nr:serine/threonine-protein kinase [Vulcanisaeta thermophila]
MVSINADKVIKALPGTILYLSLLPIIGVNFNSMMLLIALFVLSYNLFRRYPLRSSWISIPLITEIVLALGFALYSSFAEIQYTLAVVLGLSIVILGLRGLDIRVSSALLAVYLSYLLYQGYSLILLPSYYLLVNAALIFMASIIINLRNSVLMYNVNLPEDVMDWVMIYLGMVLVVPMALQLYYMHNSYTAVFLELPAALSSMVMLRRFTNYIAMITALLILVRMFYSITNVYWVLTSITALVLIILYLRSPKLRYIRGLAPPLSWIGAWIGGKYLIEGVIAVGGFSYVLKGRDESGRVYAIKVLKDRDSRGNPLANDQRVLNSFRKEMSEYLLIDSPRIVRVFEVHIPSDDKIPYKSLESYLEDPPYLVMEYMEGGSLRDLLREKGPLDLPQFLRVAHSIAMALSELHSMNILHLDLKPENILFKDKERSIVKLGDLGAAKIMIGGKSYVSQFSIAYSAPEVSRGIADVRSDIYSLSCILYEMLTGVNPHMHRLTTGQVLVPPITRFRVDVPPQLADVVMKGLELNPDRRPQSVSEYLTVISSLMNSLHQ